MITTKSSRFVSFKALETTHRDKPFLDLVNSKQWKTFLVDTLENYRYNIAVIPASMEYRPDMIANAAYGTVNLWWVICTANHIIDPNTELVAGKEIRLPII